jgi:translation elongation factor EF-1beta/SAM-dependent methyltransferase
MSEESSIAKSLLELGDPSGHQDRAYWDDWFKSVCCDSEHRPFEWYTSPEQVLRVLSYHLKETLQQHGPTNGASGNATPRRMIHPGSGTSLVPLALSAAYPDYSHVIVEVSPVAKQEMKEFHEKEFRARNSALQKCPIDYIVADLLDSSSLDLVPSSFDAWIDKGFIDAVFSEKNQEENREQAKHLFRQAHRLLVENGIVLIVTLAERHSLKIVLENWAAVDDNETLWSTLHLWEMKPVSGEMLPFGLVLIKSKPVTECIEEPCLVFHPLEGAAFTINMTSETVLDTVHDYVSRAREAYSKNIRSNDQRYMLVTLDIKPYDAETDLAALGERIVAMQWRADGEEGPQQDLKPVWQAYVDDGNEMCKIIPIGFGISKLRLKCIIQADDTDALVSAIEDWEGDDVMEGVQSVDIDWDESVAIADVSKLFKDRR